MKIDQKNNAQIIASSLTITWYSTSLRNEAPKGKGEESDESLMANITFKLFEC